MATIRVIAEEKATGRVKRIFEEFKRLRKVERIPAIWRAMAANPDYLEATWNRYKAIMLKGKLDLLTKEIIALADGLGIEPDMCPPGDSNFPKRKPTGQRRGRTLVQGRRSRR